MEGAGGGSYGWGSRCGGGRSGECVLLYHRRHHGRGGRVVLSEGRSTLTKIRIFAKIADKVLPFWGRFATEMRSGHFLFWECRDGRVFVVNGFEPPLSQCRLGVLVILVIVRKERGCVM